MISRGGVPWQGTSQAHLGETEAHEAGRLLGMTKTADVVDAVVVTTALRQKIRSSDIERLVTASGRQVAVVAI